MSTSERAKCPCCGGAISMRATVCPLCGHQKGSAGLHHVLKWLAATLGAIACVFMDFSALSSSSMSAIQQAAQIAAGIGLAIGPYVYAKATTQFIVADTIAVPMESAKS